MKLFTTLFTLGLGVQVMAQSIEIYVDGGSTDLSGTVVSLQGGEDIHEYFDIYNASAGDLDLKCERVKLIEVAGSSDYLCWGLDLLSGVCYSSTTVGPNNPWTTPDVFTWNPGDTGLLAAYFVANGYDGTALFRYYVIDDATDTKLDSIDVEFVSTVGLDQYSKIEVSAYPNPAKAAFNIVLTGTMTEEHKAAFYSLGGAHIQTVQLYEGTNKVDISNMASGIYFYSIFRGIEVIETKKLVVR